MEQGSDGSKFLTPRLLIIKLFESPDAIASKVIATAGAIILRIKRTDLSPLLSHHNNPAL